ncbi:MAG: hypothetical protein Q9191_003539 [Dirinaria sp. TL-2023a]
MATAQDDTNGQSASSQAAAAASSALAAASGFTDSSIPASLYSAVASEVSVNNAGNPAIPSDLSGVFDTRSLSDLTGTGTATGQSGGAGGTLTDLAAPGATTNTGSTVMSTGVNAMTGGTSTSTTSKPSGSAKTPTPTSTKHTGVGARATAGVMAVGAGAMGVLGVAAIL